MRRIEVIGGGPAGLFAAILIKRARPGAAVTVYERSVPDETSASGSRSPAARWSVVRRR